MRSREPLAGAIIGALVLVVANVVFAWFATAPDHYEWTDSAIFMSPFAAAFGAIAGAATGALLRRTPTPTDRRDTRKRKYLR
jgi:membrane associated rhomboid family serine protease